MAVKLSVLLISLAILATLVLACGGSSSSNNCRGGAYSDILTALASNTPLPAKTKPPAFAYFTAIICTPASRGNN